MTDYYQSLWLGADWSGEISLGDIAHGRSRATSVRWFALWGIGLKMYRNTFYSTAPPTERSHIATFTVWEAVPGLVTY